VTPNKPSPLTPANGLTTLVFSSQAHLVDKATHDDGKPQTPEFNISTVPSTARHDCSLAISCGHTVSVLLISSALETILASKEAKLSVPLHNSAQKALEMIHASQGGDKPRDIFEPLRLACETRSDKLMITSLDCVSKLIPYSFFAEEASSQPLPSHSPSPALLAQHSMAASQINIPQPSFVDLVVHTITNCQSETTSEAVSLQVIKALLALVLSPTTNVHDFSLLKALRTVYNVFLLSTDLVNQMAAQDGLTQMVHHIFTRCRSSQPNDSKDASNFRPSVSSSRFLPSFNMSMTIQSRPFL